MLGGVMLSDKARGGARLLIGLLMAMIALASAVVYAIRADGPMTQGSALQAEILADVLPPPAFVVEPYLNASLIVHNPDRAGPISASSRTNAPSSRRARSTGRPRRSLSSSASR